MSDLRFAGKNFRIIESTSQFTPSKQYLNNGQPDPEGGLYEGDDARHEEDGGDDVAPYWVIRATISED